MELILASTSKFRKKQLEDLDISFEAVNPNFNEEEFKLSNLPAEQLVQKLALGKAASLKDQYPNHKIIGADQLVYFDGKILGKAGTEQDAINQLLSLSGKTHQLLTAVCLVYRDTIKEHLDRTYITMRSLSSESAKDYVKKFQTWESAGSYKFECQGARVISKVQTEDPTSIIGLPTMTLMSWI